MDIVVTGENDRQITTWYEKPTDSGRVLNYLSQYSRKQKVYGITNLTGKVSDPRFDYENIYRLKKIFQK